MTKKNSNIVWEKVVKELIDDCRQGRNRINAHKSIFNPDQLVYRITKNTHQQ